MGVWPEKKQFIKTTKLRKSNFFFWAAIAGQLSHSKIWVNVLHTKFKNVKKFENSISAGKMGVLYENDNFEVKPNKVNRNLLKQKLLAISR